MSGKINVKMTPSGLRILFLLSVAIPGSIQKSTPASLSYRAAVVEYEPIIHANDSRKTTEENAERFVNFIDEASNKDVDIIVFPELGLTPLELQKRAELMNWATFVPNPSLNYTPCEDPKGLVTGFLKNISCAAERNSIYVVVNIVEKEMCSLPDPKECPADGLYFYSSNVAFDRRGKIVARYRKSNGFNEFGAFDAPKLIEISTIETDFGVTFGNAISLDIFNEEPGLTLTRKLGVTDIVCPTAWYSVMPFMTAIQTQAGWAHAKDVNLLAAGYNKLNRGNFGSGIYGGRRGVLKSTLPLSENGREILVSEVTKKPKKPVSAVSVTASANNEIANPASGNEKSHIIHDELRRKRHLMLPYFRYEKFDGFETQLVVPNENDKALSVVQKLSHNEIVCEFKLNLTAQLSNPKPIYRYVAFDGVSISDQVRFSGVKICALVFCANESIDSCGQLRPAPAFFDSIEINARFKNPAETLMTPNTLNSHLLPITIDKWNFRQLNDEGRATITLKTSTENLIAFGVWGRNFAESGASSVSKMFNPVIICVSLLLLILQNISHHFSQYL